MKNIQSFGRRIHDQLEIVNQKIWEVEQDLKFIKLEDGKLYIKSLRSEWQLFLDKVISFDCGFYLCICMDQKTSIYSFDLQPLDTTALQLQKVVAGARHFIAIDFMERVWVFGSNLHGQLGIDQIDTLEWQINLMLEGINVVDVAAGDLFSLFATDDGIVYSCGSNEFGQLGKSLNGFENIGQNIPRPIFESESTAQVKLAAGSRHALILAGDVLYGSGWSKYGQLGEKIEKIYGFKHIFRNYRISNVRANNWETILEIEDQL